MASPSDAIGPPPIGPKIAFIERPSLSDFSFVSRSAMRRKFESVYNGVAGLGNHRSAASPREYKFYFHLGDRSARGSLFQRISIVNAHLIAVAEQSSPSDAIF